ncbi:MAG: hypothetical protein ACI88H_001192 [Cocleimonas sp.]|jgi:hypothetical protein
MSSIQLTNCFLTFLKQYFTRFYLQNYLTESDIDIQRLLHRHREHRGKKNEN